MKHESLRALLSIAAAKDLEMVQLDVKTAFLNGDLEEELYMEQPVGFVETDREAEICHLKKSLYGLKQASRAWNAKFHGFLAQYGLTRSTADPCICVRKEDDEITIMAIWVDDGLICSTRQNKLNDIVGYLSRNFEMTSGTVDNFIGIKITRNRLMRTIHMTKESYILQILRKFQMDECNSRAIPADPLLTWSKRTP